MNSQTRNLIAYYAVLFAVGLMAGCLGPAIPELAKNTHSSLSEVSLVFSMRPAGYLLGTLLAGRLMDRMPGHPVLIAALALAAASLTLTPQMATLASLTLLVLLLGFSDGTMDVGANTLLPWVYGEKSGPYFIGLHFMFGLGALTAPILIERSFHFSGSIHSGFLWMGLFALPVIVGLLFIPSPAHQAKKDDAAAPVDKRLLLLIVLCFLAYGGAESAFGNWIFSYARARNLADDSGAAFMTSLYWGALTLGRLAALPISFKAAPGSILKFDAALCLLSVGAILIFPGSSSLLWAATAALGLGMASFFPTLMSYAGRRLAPDGRVSGGITSLFFVGSSGGSIILPWLIGQGFERLGPATAPAFIFASLLGMAALTLVLARPR